MLLSITEFKFGNVFTDTCFFQCHNLQPFLKFCLKKRGNMFLCNITAILKFPHFSLDLLADVLSSDQSLEQKFKFLRQNNFLQ